MKHNFKYFIITLFILTFEKSFSIDPLKLTDDYWLFESMTTITKAKREKISILYQDNNNYETLTFKSKGILEYYIINDGIEHNGLAKWSLDKENLTIISDKDTTNSIIEIEDGFLTIITQDTELRTNYTFTTIIKYQNKTN